jgi:lysophospholipase L1-like esterase
MLFVGASITAGSGATTPMLGYPQVLVAQVEREVGTVDAVVVGHGGAVVAEAERWPLREGEDLIMVHLATNDFEHAIPVLTYRAQYRALLARLRASSPIASLICLGVWSASVDVNRLGLHPAAYDAEVRSACESMGGSFVPLSGIFAESDLHAPPARWRAMGGRQGLAGPDVLQGREIGFHPNDAGHERIAATVFAAAEARHMLRPPGEFLGASLARYA